MPYLIVRFMIGFVVYFAVSLGALAQTTQDLDRVEIGCLISKNVTACAQAYRLERRTADAGEFARVGCDELKSAASCVDLGDWHRAHRNLPVAKTYFEKGCSETHGQGCHRLIELLRAEAEKLDGEALKAVVADAEKRIGTACTPAVEGDAACATSRKLLGETKRRDDPEFGRCVFTYQIFRAEGATEAKVRTSAGDGLSDLLTKPDCSARCGTWAAQVRATEATQLHVRGRCAFNGAPLGSAYWARLSENKNCPVEGRSIGTETKPSFARCACEAPIKTAANAAAESAGAYVRAEAVLASNFGGKKWFRCGVGVYWDDAAVDALAKDCPQKVAAVKRALSSEASLKGLFVNYARLTCGASAPAPAGPKDVK